MLLWISDGSVQLAGGTQTGQGRLRLCGISWEKFQGCVKHMRQK